jgi:hypothetical protein
MRASADASYWPNARFSATVTALAITCGAAVAQDLDWSVLASGYGMQAPPIAAPTNLWQLPAWRGPSGGPTWRVGTYVGALSHQAFVDIAVVQPWKTKFEADYLIDFHAVYTAYRFERIPLELELEGGFAQRFGQNHQSEFDLIPMARWTWFPWNGLVYTNFRLGLLGASYVTGISQWELQNSGANKGSRFLNLLLPEVTFSSSPEAPFEVFVRVHHRSGIYGRINGIGGASNYPAVGVRFAIQ